MDVLCVCRHDAEDVHEVFQVPLSGSLDGKAMSLSRMLSRFYHGGRELVYSLANKTWLMQSHSPDGATVASGSTEAVQQHVTAAEMMLCGCEFLFFKLQSDCLIEKQNY